MTFLILYSYNANTSCYVLSHDYNKDSQLLKDSHFDLIIMNDIEKEFYLLLLFQQRYSELQIIIGDYYNIDLPTLDYVIINDQNENKAFDDDDGFVSNNHYQVISFASHIHYNPEVRLNEKHNLSEFHLDENNTYAVIYMDDIFYDEYFETLSTILNDIKELVVIVILEYNNNIYYK